MSRRGVPEPATRSLPVAKGRPRVVVIAGARTSTHVVSASGQVVIGREPACDVRIDDASISRRHARITVGDTIVVEDLGSSNGTVVRGKQLTKGKPAELRYDEVVTVGNVSVVIQKHAPVAAAHTLWGHGYFELRLAEECARAARAGTSFALLRVRSTDGDAVAEQLVAALREIDVIGSYAPGEWEVLLVDTPADEVDRIVAHVRSTVSDVDVARAQFPADGHDAWSLSSAVSRRLDESPATHTDAVLAPVGAMKPLLDLIDRVAVGDISILILGETGVGKEVVAEEVHRRSRRAKRGLVKLNCAALPEQLLESELFGHEKGAFTGAVTAKTGLLEEADGGTVFLDEIGELPPAIQVKLLRVIEQRTITRVGSVKPRKIDVRFVAATHRDLDDAIAAGRFREDLYFRLAGVTLNVPPLRERIGELDDLVARFSTATATALGRSVPSLSKSAMAVLRGHRWPGNVRELRNAIERATLLCDGVIEPRHLSEDRMTRPEITAVAAPSMPGFEGVRQQTDQLERQAIADALARTGDNQTKAARLLGISRRTLTNKLNAYGFERPRKRT